MNENDDDAAFRITAIPIGHYQHHPPIEQVGDEVAQVVDILREFGGYENEPRAASGEPLDETSVKQLLRGWASGTMAHSSVLLWFGHGASDGEHAWLASYETPDPINGNGIVPQTVADQIENDWRRRFADETAWSLIVIEACGAGRFVKNMGSILMSADVCRTALIGVGGDGTAYLGRFKDALCRTKDSYSVNDESISFRDFVYHLNDYLESGALVPLELASNLRIPRKRLIETPISAPIDVYRELIGYLATLSPDERSHFIPKAQGAEYGELSWYFVGRTAERRQISAWLRDSTAGMLIVTGRAGTGKSALLGNVIVHTNQELRKLLIASSQLEEETADNLPPDNPFDAVVHLTGMGTSELIGRIARAAGVPLPTAQTAESGQDLEALLTALRGRSLTILVDALDEAQDPAAIASSVLRRLAALPRTRVIVGTRASTKEGPDQPFTSDQDLLDALGQSYATKITVERDPAALAHYIRRRLASALEKETEDEAVIERIAELSSGPGREFLFARLAVHEILARPRLLRDDFREDLENLLRGDHRSLFAAAVSRLTSEMRTARQLLEALAIGRGRGVPRADRIWATVAGAITNGAAPHEIDVDQLLTAAAPYIMLDAEDGQSVYRLAHQTFREFFVRSAGPGQTFRHAAISRHLMGIAEKTGVPNPYIVHRLAEHVAEAGAWQELADAPGVLDQLDPESVAAEALRTGYGRANLPPAINASLSARHLLSSVAPADRWMTRGIAMVCLGSADVSPESSAMSAGPNANWAWMSRPDPLHVQLIGHEGPVTAATTMRMPDGRVLLATGSVDGTVRMWDPSTGRPVGDPIMCGGSAAFRLAAFHSGDGRVLLAIGDGEGRVRLWDPGTGQFYTPPVAAHAGPVLDIVTLSQAHRRDVLVTSGFDRTVLTWEVADGRPVTYTPLITGYRIRALSASGGPYGQPLLVTGGYDGEVRLWNPLTGVQLGNGLTGHSGAIHSVAMVAAPPGHYFVAAAGEDAIKVWTRSGEPRSNARLLRGHAGAVHAIAALAVSADKVLLASGGEDKTVRLWDLGTGQPVGEPLTGHARSIRALTPIELEDGRTLLATGAEDNTIRIWDPSAARRPAGAIRRRTPPRLRSMTAATMPDGSSLLLTGDDDGRIHLRDLRSGAIAATPAAGDAIPVHTMTVAAIPGDGAIGGDQIIAATGPGDSITRWNLGPARLTPMGTPLYGHTGMVRAITPVRLHSGKTGLASGGNDEKILLWEAATGRPAGVLLRGHRNSVSALAAVTTGGGESLLASAGDSPDVVLWNLGTLRPAARLPGNGASFFTALTVLSGPLGQATIAAATRDGWVYLWDANGDNPALIRSWQVSQKAVLVLAAMRLPSGRELLITASADGCLRFWSPSAGVLKRTVPLPLDQQPRNLVTMGTTIAIQTDVAVIVTEIDPLLAAS